MKQKAKIVVIGSGVAGLSAAAFLGKENFQVHVMEKNASVGGRARQFKAKGYTFDMGPSWYWMPDIMEGFFNRFGYTASDFFELRKLDPGFQMIFPDGQVFRVPACWEELSFLFEQTEKGAARKLEKFISQAALKYKYSVGGLMYKPSLSVLEFLHPDVFRGFASLQLFSSFSAHVRNFFKDPRLIALMEFPVLFLGAMPDKTPALYSLMNYAGIKLGTYYPMGGFGKLTGAMEEVARAQGAEFHLNNPVTELAISAKKVIRIKTAEKSWEVDGVIGAADYHHIEQHLLPEQYRNYDEYYWSKRTLAPSCLLFYLGVNKKLPLLHHNLFFDQDLMQHGKDIYVDHRWPSNPLFYVCCPSKTDPHVAPEQKENLMVLMPISSGLEDTDTLREHYYGLLMSRLEKFTGTTIGPHVEYKKSYCIRDFKNDYNAYKGNGYGLANTLRQTAVYKPKIRSRKLRNLFFAGQLTVPGPGVPPSIISGQIAADLLTKTIKK